MEHEQSQQLADYLSQAFETRSDLQGFLFTYVWPRFKAKRQTAKALNSRFVSEIGNRLSDGQVEWCANTGKIVIEISTARSMTYNKTAKKWEYNT